MELIPKGLRENHHKLNTIRNRYAHRLDFALSELAPEQADFADFDQTDLHRKVPRSEDRWGVKGLHKKLSDPPTRDETHNILRIVALVAFGWQHNIILLRRGEYEPVVDP
jgi:hypothetical protein